MRFAIKDRKHERLAVAKIGGCWMGNVIVLAKALHYARAARRDERNSFHYTAAMEWHHAAELFVSSSLAAEYCWEQWERIMHLPRQHAEPIGSCELIVEQVTEKLVFIAGTPAHVAPCAPGSRRRTLPGTSLSDTAPETPGCESSRIPGTETTNAKPGPDLDLRSRATGDGSTVELTLA
jgi:hypothetical protein